MDAVRDQRLVTLGCAGCGYGSTVVYVDSVMVKIVMVALAAAVSAVVALVTGILVRVAGAHPAIAVLQGGAAFGRTLALVVVVLTVVGVL